MMNRIGKTLAGTATLAAGLLLLGAAGGNRQARAEERAKSALPLTGTWTVDPWHTNVNFAVRHLGISLVRGRFDEVSGTIVADSDHPEKSSVQITIPTASIDTNVKMRDDDLRSDHYFDAAKYPQITFTSTRVEKVKDGFLAHGNLMMHGVTKEIALPYHISGPIKDPFGGTRFGVETAIHLNRKDFGIGGQDALPNGDLAIGNDIDVTISLEATPPTQKPA